LTYIELIPQVELQTLETQLGIRARFHGGEYGHRSRYLSLSVFGLRCTWRINYCPGHTWSPPRTHTEGTLAHGLLPTLHTP